MQSARKRAGPGLPEFSCPRAASCGPGAACRVDLGGFEAARSRVANRKDMDFRIGILAGILQRKQTVSRRISAKELRGG